MKHSIFLILTIIGLAMNAAEFPIFDDQKTTRPEGMRQVQTSDFKISPKMLDVLPEKTVYGDKATLRKLADFFMNDPSGIESWTKYSDNCVQIVNQWDFNRKGFGADRYVYRFPALEWVAMVYIYTGNKELGEFIRSHMLQVASLPYEFWLHSELRGYDKKKPLGMLETASLSTTVSSTLSATESLFSDEEKIQIRTALKEKGQIPCLNWLDKPAKNNFTAIISSGAYIASKYLEDKAGMQKALAAMKTYLSESIESDGSYGEGSGYFSYPISGILSATLAMSPEDRSELFKSSGLRYSSSWECYPFLYETDKDGKTEGTMLHFGDNSFHNPPTSAVNSLLTAIYKDEKAVWLLKKFDVKKGWKERLLLYSCGLDNLKEESPEEAKLPLVKNFENGDAFIRSSWKDNSTVLALHAGNGSRIKFSHQRAEMNSIGLGAFGEYLIVSPGSASYRSPLHYNWDFTTKAANTISIDDKNQKFPGSGSHKWSTVDSTKYWVTGTPEAKIIDCRSAELADILISEGAKSYEPDMKHVLRAVIFVRNPGYFVIIDRMEAVSSEHKYTSNLHFNNRDEKGVLSKESDSQWNLKRPKANLKVAFGTDGGFQSEIYKGYMHGKGRDYSPGGEHEGALGSSIGLALWNSSKSKASTFTTVLYPYKSGTTAPEIKITGSDIVVGKDNLQLKDGTLGIRQSGGFEEIKIW